jgi:hypothetical protein
MNFKNGKLQACDFNYGNTKNPRKKTIQYITRLCKLKVFRDSFLCFLIKLIKMSHTEPHTSDLNAMDNIPAIDDDEQSKNFILKRDKIEKSIFYCYFFPFILSRH